MYNFVFVVLCALLVGGALGEAALGNYYKDVVREQHKLINEMNQNFTELEKASEKLIDLGFYVGKHKLPPKTVKITKTVAVKVPVPFPVKVPEPVPVPVPVSKPVPVPVPTLVAIPVESTVATLPAVTVAGNSNGDPSPSPAPTDADPASSQAHASTVQVQEYVQSFPIHSVYDAGDDYNPMEGNRLALAEHTASPTESTFSKPSPSSLQQLEEYHHQHHQHHHAQQHSQQSKHHQHQSATQTGSHSSAEQYYGGHGIGGSGGAQRQYYVGGAQVQTGAHPAAKFRPESHALQPAAESYDFGDSASQFHSAAFARATDSPYSAASGLTGDKSAPSASSAIGEDYHFATEQQQQQFQRGQHGESNFETEQFSRGGGGGGRGGDAGTTGRGGESSGGRIFGGEIGGIGGTGGDPQASAHSYVKFSETADLHQQADHEAAPVPRYQSEGETRLQAGFEAGFQEGLQATHQAGLEAGLQAGLEAGLQAEQAAEKGAHRHGAGTKGQESNELTPRPFQTVRESYPHYEKPDLRHYHGESGDRHNHHHHQTIHNHHHTDHSQQTAGRGGSSTGSILTEGYDHPAFAKSNRPAAAGVTTTATGTLSPAAPTHGYTVSGERSIYPPVSTAGYHHTHPYPANLPGEAHKDLRHQADATGAERFPFYHATKHDPHLARPALKPYHSGAAAGPAYQLQQQYGDHKESQARGAAAQTELRQGGTGGYSTYTEHHNYHHHHHYLNGQQHDRPKHKGSYGSRSIKPIVYSVPSDAHLYPGYNQHHAHQHGSASDATNAGNHAGTAGKFHYHFHNVHPVGAGSGPDHHHESAASEQYTVHTEYGGVAGPDGSVVTSYDPPASGSTIHFHDDGTGDMFAGASTVQEQHRAPYGESSDSYRHTQ